MKHVKYQKIKALIEERIVELDSIIDELNQEISYNRIYKPGEVDHSIEKKREYDLERSVLDDMSRIYNQYNL